MPVRKTRKMRHQTVESLQASFEKIDAKMRELILRGTSDAALASVLRKLWVEHFHEPLGPAALKGMLHHYRTITRKTRKQRGGSAPLNWTMGPAAPMILRVPELQTDVSEYPVDSNQVQKGGAPWTWFMPPSVPRNELEIAVSTLQGAPISNPVASPVAASLTSTPLTVQPYDASHVHTISQIGPTKGS